MTQLSCCGSGTRNAATDPTSHDTNGGTVAMHDNTKDTDRHRIQEVSIASSNTGLLESASSFSSIDTNSNAHESSGSKKLHDMANGNSPTSIDTILFGAAVSSMK